MDPLRHGDPILQTKGMVAMTDYHFRVNAERLGISPLTITTREHWGDGECRFEIEAPASEEVLSLALHQAVRLIGLRADRTP
jgi:hypothetical protein